MATIAITHDITEATDSNNSDQDFATMFIQDEGFNNLDHLNAIFPSLHEAQFRNFTSPKNSEQTLNDIWCEDASIQSLVDDFALVNSVSTKTPSEMRYLLDRWHLVNYILMSHLSVFEGLTMVQVLECYRDFKGYTNLHLSQEIESIITLNGGRNKSGKEKMDKALLEFFNGVAFENEVK